jgi:hypothetical protein
MLRWIEIKPDDRLQLFRKFGIVAVWRATDWNVSISPTILAWDWSAIRRILLLEAAGENGQPSEQ